MSAAETTTATVPPTRPSPPPGTGAATPAKPGRKPTRGGAGVPWLLLAPCLLILLLVLGYPLVRLVTLSFQKFGQPQLWGFKDPESVGFGNFSKILGDSEFWTVVVRTAVFAVSAVRPDHGHRHADRPAAAAGLRLGARR